MDRREYRMPCPPQRFEAVRSPADFTALPTEIRDDILARAEDAVRRQNPVFWLNAKGTRARERLIQQQVKEIVDRERQTAR